MFIANIFIVRLILLFCFTTPVTEVFAKSQNKSFASITTYYSNYSDISLDSNSTKLEMPKSLEVELALRLRSIFNFTFVAQRFLHDEESSIGTLKAERQAFGLGLKIDLPGIFFIGNPDNFAKRKGKNWPINTYLYGNLQRVNTTNESGARDSSFASRYGFGLDIFLFNQVAYTSFYFGAFQSEANTFLQSGVGLGVAL